MRDAERRVKEGYYRVAEQVEHTPVSLAEAVRTSARNAVIAEIKPMSPSRGNLRPSVDPVEAALKLKSGGAVALSVLTEPDNFGGNLENLRHIRPYVGIPLLMKDIVIDAVQIHAAKATGADSVLLIDAVLSRCGRSTNSMISLAHDLGLEALVEVHDENEMRRALHSPADLIGVNNRNLATLEIDLETTKRLMTLVTQRNGRPFITESGIESVEDIRRLRKVEVDGFLVGSSIMVAPDLESKVREFVYA